jgi:hypothetical protein
MPGSCRSCWPRCRIVALSLRPSLPEKDRVDEPVLALERLSVRRSWAELVQVHDDRNVFQGSPDELPDIDIHSL